MMLGIQSINKILLISPPFLSSSSCFSCNDDKIKSRNNSNKNVGFWSSNDSLFCRNEVKFHPLVIIRGTRRRTRTRSLKVEAVGNVGAPLWDNTWSPDKSTPSPPLSDILWPSLGAFAAMAMLGKMDQVLATRGVSSITIAPLGAVCAVLFVTPKSPAARKYNMFMAQIGCAAIGVLAYSIFGPGWLARSAALAASIAFMIYTKSTHPPAASLPLLFIDGAKFHGLNFWYALFPGAAGCIIICLIQEIVSYLQQNVKF